MSQPRNTIRQNVRKPFQSVKSVMGTIALSLKRCVNPSESSKASFKVKKQHKLVGPNKQWPPISSSGHGSCPGRKEGSSTNFVSQQAEALYHSSFQIESILRGDCQESEVDSDNANTPGQGHNGTVTAVMECDDGASAQPSSNTTLSKTLEVTNIGTIPGLKCHERDHGLRSEHQGKTYVPQIGGIRKNNINSHLCSNEPINAYLVSESARGTAPQTGRLFYENLGIITGHPRKPEFATEDKRRRTFEGWPSEHHLKPDDLVKAGFYYSGYKDCVRCFYCNGGIRRWEDGDDEWVEHARLFPQCGFLRQNVGCAFIDVVQELKEEQKMITYVDVLTKLDTKGLKDSIPKDVKRNTSELDQDCAVETFLDAGLPHKKVMNPASHLHQMGKILAGDLNPEEMMMQEATSRPRDTTENVNDLTKETSENVKNLTKVQDTKAFKKEQETCESLKNKIAELQLFGLCKICMDKEVSVVFLPCSHLISCLDCSYAFKSCPICRNSIEGIVRAFLS